MSALHKILLSFAFAIGSFVVAAHAQAVNNYQSLWYAAPAESEGGWGINVAHQGDIVFATWFTYDSKGKAWWLSMTANKTGGTDVYRGTLYETRGPAFNAVPFSPAAVTSTAVGSGTLSFSDTNTGSFAYTVNGVTQTKAITRQVFGPMPTCVFGALSDLAKATNYQDLWWAAPAGAESGWGVNFTHQGDIIFATWFTYDADGTPLWLSATAPKTGPGVYAGALYRTTGPAFSAIPFDPSKVGRTAVGTLTLNFSDGNHATFGYTLNGISQTKPITRQVFVLPGTVCTSPPSAAEVRKDAARFLRQATFGAQRGAIDALVTQGYTDWLDKQFAKPAISHLATVTADPNLPEAPWTPTMASLWKQFFEGDDQLRQRVGFALSQIFVVSMRSNTVQDAACGTASYLDALNRGGFGNFRDLLKDVTLSPVMGEYLSMKQSAKADPVLQTQPDENYAREVMQLFSVGLVMLNNDGSVKLDADGKPIPTYNEDTVKGFAKALSGWTHAGQDQSKPWVWIYPDIWDPDPIIKTQKACPAWSAPMQPWTAGYRPSDGNNNRVIAGPAHDTGAKQLLVYLGSPYSTLPAGQSPQTDLENVLDNIFFHPNVGPFIAKQLIQRLVTSNPSPQYVQRVAQKFNDNGSGARGDMKTVVRAILLDSDARSLSVASQPSFGKLTEPAVRFVQFHRAFNAKRASGYYDLWDLGAPTFLNQSPMHAPSVFNFYHPNFTPGGPMTAANLVGPEFEIADTSALAGFSDFSRWGILPGFGNGDTDVGHAITPDYSYYLGLINNPASLLDELELVLCAGCLDPTLKSQIVQAVGKISLTGNVAAQSQERLYTALWLIINSPDYSVQK